MNTSQEKQVKEEVKRHYARLARGVSSCCGPPCSSKSLEKMAQMMGYTEKELSSLPKDVVESSFGCGNPLAFSEIREGEVVLDIGSGAGIDVILAAKRVGKRGKVIGLDMTPEMIEKAVKNAQKAGVEEMVEFRLGEMENMPIDDESVDWIISNCVINLSPDKERVFQEAYRVLKPGGRMLISDLVSSRLPQEIKNDLSSWAGCVAGTVEESEYLDIIRRAGFEDVAVIDKVDFTEPLLSEGFAKISVDPSNPPKIYSIKIRAVKPFSAKSTT